MTKIFFTPFPEDPDPPHGLRNFGARRVGLHTTWSAPQAKNPSYATGVPSPADYGVWASVVSSPSGRVRGWAPAAIAFSACFRPQNASSGKKNTINCKFHFEKVVVTVASTFKSADRHIQSCAYAYAYMQLIRWMYCIQISEVQNWRCSLEFHCIKHIA